MNALRRPRIVAVTMVLLALWVLPTQTVNARPPNRPAVPTAQTGMTEKAPKSVAGGNRRIATTARLATIPAVPLASCTEDPEWLCGSIRVPVDRAAHDGRTFDIGFRVLPHRDPLSTSRDALLASSGGPGISSTGDQGFFQFLWILSSTTETSCWSTIAARGPPARSTALRSRTVSSTTMRSWPPRGPAARS